MRCVTCMDLPTYLPAYLPIYLSTYLPSQGGNKENQFHLLPFPQPPLSVIE